ncbi:MAG TPA: hypothetical protein VFU89_07005 [Rhabdochlamydiaceae bacterium]|nr:hypothetical protein [Rhabdochlamydiaceae bacterium]
MIELTQHKKNKITLSDYNYRRDIENRLLLASFTAFEIAVLEEILYSPIKASIRKIAKNIEKTENEIVPILEILCQTGLFIIEGDSIVVDKETRKYFETEIEKFAPDFCPGMEFLQNILKKVPIHLLPIWYSIPRTSNNIFESLVEKYLHTPQIFQRYLLELTFGDPSLSAIAQDLFRSPTLTLSAKDVMKKYELSREKFEENMLILELHFVCCVKFQPSSCGWEETVAPFHEWREYLTFLKATTTEPITDTAKIERFRSHDFAFIEDLTAILQLVKKQSTPLNPKGYAIMAARLQESPPNPQYLDQLITKLQLLKLAEVVDDKLQATEPAAQWLEMRIENRTLYLYRHSLNKIQSVQLPPHLTTEKVIHDAEKAILRVLHTGWVFYDEFEKGVIVPFAEHTAATLKKCGKGWKYALPDYSPEEKTLIRAIVFEWLFEAGITAVGTYQGRDCFTVTVFGQSLFG